MMKAIIAALLALAFADAATVVSGVNARYSVAAQSPARDGTIRGRVFAVDTGAPMIGAQVRVVATSEIQGSAHDDRGRDVTRSQQMSAVTGVNGEFEVRHLSLGTYRVLAAPNEFSAGYLAAAYGSKGPVGIGDEGLSVIVGGQQDASVTVALPRGGVITGKVLDEYGTPMAHVNVSSLRIAVGGPRGAASAQTDDLGQFRIYGLLPSDYLVLAQVQASVGATSRVSTTGTMEHVGFLATYSPDTPDEAAAARIKIKLGAEVTNVDIHIQRGRLYRVSGAVLDSQGRPLVHGVGRLTKRAPVGVASAVSFYSDGLGMFDVSTVLEGDYVLMIWQQPMTALKGTVPATASQMEGAVVPVSVRNDLLGLSVKTSPAVSISGNVVLEDQGNGGELSPGSVRIVTVRVGDGIAAFPAATPARVSPDLTFSIDGVFGNSLLRAGAPGYWLKSVQLSGRDITDTPHEFKADDRITLGLTSRVSTIDGRVLTPTGETVPGATVLLFSQDKQKWLFDSVDTRRTSADGNGQFRLTGVLPGRYHLVALPKGYLAEFRSDADLTTFELLSRAGVATSVGELETQHIDIRVGSMGGQ